MPPLRSAAASLAAVAEAIAIARHVRGGSSGARTPSKLRYPLSRTAGLAYRSSFGCALCLVSWTSWGRGAFGGAALVRFLRWSLLGSLRLSVVLRRLWSLLRSQLPIVARPGDCLRAEYVFSLPRSLCVWSRSRSRSRTTAPCFSRPGSGSRCHSLSSGSFCSKSRGLP